MFSAAEKSLVGRYCHAEARPDAKCFPHEMAQRTSSNEQLAEHTTAPPPAVKTAVKPQTGTHTLPEGKRYELSRLDSPLLTNPTNVVQESTGCTPGGRELRRTAVDMVFDGLPDNGLPTSLGPEYVHQLQDRLDCIQQLAREHLASAGSRQKCNYGLVPEGVV
ncbi:hypothetical protein SKAU_G00236630 [Synaphobranchus kaupii]|uniref:Uncharacterized protein n=1 Tax=Synaphobranchus kaupii TaxID=118154 RepID=A0A9Q1F6N2_SYNKA|nr:hypothetical protein SKAU_G00236630 [Synaphobranchus kaupii]